MYRFRLVSLLLIALCLSAARLLAQTPIPSFPGAVGFGGTTTGAWTLSGTNHTGGTVYHVTNLNDSGPGSFRTGVGTSGNVVVFDVGGNIQSLSAVSVASNVSIEGQTAPGGIQIYGSETGFDNSHNIICRFVHFRDGTLDPLYPGPNGTDSSTNAVNLLDTTEIMLDHCTFEFAAYNNIDAGGNGAVNVTFQNCLFGDPISYQRFNCHMQGGPVTYIDCLWANAAGRQPLGKANLQFVNNIVYNFGYGMDTGNSSGDFLWDVINNYFISGPSTNNPADAYFQVDSNQSAYATGNFLDTSSNNEGMLTGAADNSVNAATVLNTYWSSTTPSLPTLSAQNAFYYVVSIAGPVPHDPVDSLVVSDVLSLGNQGMFWTSQISTGLGNDGYGVITGGVALPDSDGSGMPDDWKAALGLSLTNPAVSGSTSSTGYTFLENYLAWKALPNAWVARNTTAQPTSVTIDLSQYSNGFGAGSTFTVSGTTNGTVTPMTGTQSGSTVFIVTFTPKLNTSGLGGFSWSVNNGITTMSSTMGVLISQGGPAQSVVWKGDGVNNYWDTATANWTLVTNGSASAFSSGDPVTFNDSGSASPPVNIDTAVSPGLMTFDAYANNYTLSGTGVIGGSGPLVKEGTASLTINNTGANTYSGGVVLDSGTIDAAVGTAFGTGAITMNGGILQSTAGSAGMTINNSINVNVGSAMYVGGGTTYLNGTVNGAGSLSLNFDSNIVLTFANSWGAYTGVLTVNGQGNLRLNNSSDWGIPDAVVYLEGPVNLYNRSTGTTTISIGALNGISSSVLQGSDQSNSGTGTYTIGALDTPSIFAGTIENSTNQTVAITTAGDSSLTLTGSSTYSGATTVSAGSTLILSGSLGNTALSIASGATFIANGVVNGSVTLNTGGSIHLGASTTPGPGTLTVGNGMTLASGTGASIYYDLSSSPTASGSNGEIIVTTGTLTMSGITNFQINLASGALGAGTYTLIGGSPTLSTGDTVYALDLPVPAGGVTRQTINLARPSSGATPAYIDLVVTGNAGVLTWSGANGAGWDLNTTSDWSGASPGTFYDLDQVTFNDSDAGGAVVLSGTLSPIILNVTSNVSNYQFTGAGLIAGSTQLIKSGSATITIENTNPNTFTGSVNINGGTLLADQTIGAGTIYLNGGALSVGVSGLSLSNSIVVQSTSTIFGANGSTYLINASNAALSSTNPAAILYFGIGSGSTLTLAYSMSQFEGTIKLGASAGALRLNNTGAGNTGSSLALFDLGTSTGSVGNRNGGITANFGAIQGGSGTFLDGRTSGSGATSSTYIVGALNTNSTFAGTISNDGDEDGLNITKVGAGNWTLSGTSNYIGAILVQQGTLTISGSDSNGGENFETQSGASLTLAGGAITTDSIQIDAGALFTGTGTLNAGFVNEGAATVSGGGTLTINGDYENDGTMTVDGSSTLVVNLPLGGGTFVNNGLLDIMDSPNTVLPAGYLNNGTILTSALVTLRSFSKSGTNFSVTIQTYTGHTYQLQKSTDLNMWQNVGAAQAGTGSPIVLTDTNATGQGLFYQVGVGP